MLFDPYTYDLTSAHQPEPSGAALAADALLAVPAGARDVLRQGLTEAVEGALDLWERVPCGHQAAPPPCAVQHAGKRRFAPAALRAQTLSGWHRLTGIELRLAAEALEALALAEDAAQRERLAEQCARVGQLYSEMERRANEWVARALLGWELKLLRYRASPVVSTLVYD
jgi:hypothetical protein